MMIVIQYEHPPAAGIVDDVYDIYSNNGVLVCILFICISSHDHCILDNAQLHVPRFLHVIVF